MSPLFPSLLKKGSTIGVVAPSSSSDQDELDAGLERLYKLGYKTKLAANLTTKTHFLAGDNNTRLNETVKMLRDESVDAVFCARGGDGAIHLIPEFVEQMKDSKPKIFLGYSDITLLQLVLYKYYNWVTFSGPMISTELGPENLTEDAEKHLWDTLTKPSNQWDLNPKEEHSVEVWRKGSAQGPLVGGCLALVTALLGSQHMPDMSGTILIIEDIDETPRHVDRMLHRLRIAGIFEQISGMIVGQFRGCFPDDPEEDFTLKELVLNATQKYDFPILGNYPYGHKTPERFTIPIGVPIQMETEPARITVDLD